jgi:hypothetical protein
LTSFAYNTRTTGLHSRTNPHWKEQVLVSNIRRFLPVMTFVGSFERLAEHAKALLESIGAWEKYGASGWGRTAAGNNNGGNGTAIFQVNNNYHRTSSAKASVRARYSTPQLEDTIRRAYWRDYSVMASIGLLQFVDDGYVGGGSGGGSGERGAASVWRDKGVLSAVRSFRQKCYGCSAEQQRQLQPLLPEAAATTKGPVLMMEVERSRDPRGKVAELLLLLNELYESPF